MHSQVAVYLFIRNMSENFAHNMGSLHLICLVNENDLKKKETDYTNILEMIVRDIKILETFGVDLDYNTNLKGKIDDENFLIVRENVVFLYRLSLQSQVRSLMSLSIIWVATLHMVWPKV